MTNIQAIDLLKGLEQSLDDYCELNDEGKTAFHMAITALEVFGNSEQLPSVQPVGKDINVSCKDAISRLGAIDICNNVIDLWQGQLGEGALVAIKNAINNLPSVQPDIIVCADCKHWVCHDKRCGYWNHGVQPLMWCSQAERRWKE